MRLKIVLLALTLSCLLPTGHEAWAAYQCPPGSRYAPNNAGQGYCLYENITLPGPGVQPYCHYLNNGYMGFMWNLGSESAGASSGSLPPPPPGQGSAAGGPKTPDIKGRLELSRRIEQVKLSPVNNLRTEFKGSQDTVYISWDSVPGATKYTVSRQQGPVLGITQNGSGGGTGVTAGTNTHDTPPAAGKYVYEVVAANESGTRSQGVRSGVVQIVHRSFDHNVNGQKPSYHARQIAPGSTVRVKAAGSVNFGGGIFGIGDVVLGPDGEPAPAPNNYPAPGLRKNSLLCKVGNGSWIQCGADKTFKTSTGGSLTLHVNDGIPGDNKGYWSVSVEDYGPQ